MDAQMNKQNQGMNKVNMNTSLQHRHAFMLPVPIVLMSYFQA